MIFYRQLFMKVTSVLWLLVSGSFVVFIFFGLMTEPSFDSQGSALLYLLFKTPHLIYEHLIFIVAIGVLIAVGRMVSRGELLCMVTSGLSFRRIIITITLATTLFYLMCTLFHETLGVKLAVEARQVRQETKTPLDVWLVEDRSVVRLGRIDIDGAVHNVQHFEYIDDTSSRYVEIESMNWDPKSRSWLEQQVHVREISPQGVRSHRVARRFWQNELNATIFRLLAHAPQHLPMRRLVLFEQARDSAYINLTHKYRNYFWRLVALPFWVVIITVMSSFLIIQFARNASVGRNIIIGVLIVLMADLSTRMLLGVSTLLLWHPLYAIIPPTLLLLLFSIYFSKKI